MLKWFWKNDFLVLMSLVALAGCTGDSGSSSSGSSLKVTGISDDDAWTSSKTWSWGCSATGATCEYRFVIDQDDDTMPSGTFSSTAEVTQAGTSGIYYLHVQPRTVSSTGTPPISTFVNGEVTHVRAKIDADAPTGLGNIDDGTASTSLSESPTLSWTAAVDEGSGLDHYEVAIGSTSGGTDVKDWTDVGILTTTLINGLSLTSGSTYFVSVRAVDAVGNASAPISGNGFLASGGAASVQVTGLSNDAVWKTSKTWTWSCSAPPCTFRYSVDTSATGVPSGAYASTATTSQSSGNGTYYLHVQAKDALEVESAVVTVSALIDNTAPSAPTSFDDGTVSSSTGSSSSASWVSGSDAHSGIANYQFALGTSAGATDVLTWTNVSGNTHQATGLSLTDGGTYYASIRSVDAVGLQSTTVNGDGFVVATGSISVTGISNDGTWKTSKSWTWSCDATPCTYRHSIDTNVSGVPSGAYNSTTSATQSSGSGTYYLHVQAKDVLGRVSAVSTVSVLLDNTAPTAPSSLDDGSSTPVTHSSPTATWNASTDSHSGVASYRVAIGTTQGGTDILSWDTSATTSYQRTGLTLTNGTTYYTSVRAVDSVGNLGAITEGNGWIVNNIEQKIKASDGLTTDQLGQKIAAYGGVVAAAAPQRDHSGSDKAGGVYFYRQNGSTWTQEGLFVATDHANNQYCGTNLDFSGAVAIVGCTNAAYVARYNGSSWAQDAKLVASTGSTIGTVAIDSEWAVVGVNEGVAGQIKIFRHTGSTWTHFSTHDSPNANFTDGFGGAVDISGNLIAVGAIGVNDEGRVYIYRFDGSAWSLAATIAANDPVDWDYFGESVSIFGHHLAVSAPNRNSNQGAVYTYQLEGTSWVHRGTLVDTSPANNAYFGKSIALQGDMLAVGIPGVVGVTSGKSKVYRYDGSAWGLELTYAPTAIVSSSHGQAIAFDGETVFVSDHLDDDNGNSSGAFYARRINSDPVAHTNLIAADAAAGDNFGISIAAFGNKMLVGAMGKDTNKGAAYIFRKGASTWAQAAKLTASDGATGDYFGDAVAMFGNLAVVGAPEADVAGQDIAGAVYVYRYDGSAWPQIAKISPAVDSSYSSAQFGTAVDIEGETIVVGASNDDSQVSNGGRAYVYRFDGSVWTKQAELVPSDPLTGASFGSDIAIRGNTVVVGASGASNGSARTGAVYVFQFDGTSWAQTQKLTPPGSSADWDNFGDLDLDDGVLAVTALGNDIAANGAGSLYFYHYNGSTFVHKSTHQVSGAAATQWISGVALFGGKAVVGQPETSTYYGNQYLFSYAGSAWTETAVHSPYTETAMFGISSAIFGTQVFGGAYFKSPGGGASIADY